MRISDFKIDGTYNHSDIVEAFECGNMGGMRRSKKTNTLMLICDHTKGLYDDMWHGDVLHYTGMGKGCQFWGTASGRIFSSVSRR